LSELDYERIRNNEIMSIELDSILLEMELQRTRAMSGGNLNILNSIIVDSNPYDRVWYEFTHIFWKMV